MQNKKFISLFLSCTAAHTSTSIYSLSLSLNSKAWQMEIPRWTSPVPTRLAFVSSENAQNRLSFSLFPTSNAGSFLIASNTWRCKKLFFSFSFFWFFLFTEIFFFFKLTYTSIYLIKCFNEDDCTNNFF